MHCTQKNTLCYFSCMTAERASRTYSHHRYVHGLLRIKEHVPCLYVFKCICSWQDCGFNVIASGYIPMKNSEQQDAIHIAQSASFHSTAGRIFFTVVQYTCQHQQSGWFCSSKIWHCITEGLPGPINHWKWGHNVPSNHWDPITHWHNITAHKNTNISYTASKSQNSPAIMFMARYSGFKYGKECDGTG